MSVAHKIPCVPIRAANDSGPRRPADVRLVVIHSAEAEHALGVANYFARRSTQASTQLVIDDESCYRCVPDLVIPWGAPGANRHGLHIEHCGYARWSRERWLKHKPMLERSAWRAATWCWTFGVYAGWITTNQLKQGVSGFVTHAQCSAAFPPNDGHFDPGGGFPKPLYMQLVRKYLAEITRERAAGRKT